MCVSKCMCTCWRRYVCVEAGISLSHYKLYFLRPFCHWIWNLTVWLGCLARRPQVSYYFFLHCSVDIGTCHYAQVYVGAENGTGVLMLANSSNIFNSSTWDLRISMCTDSNMYSVISWHSVCVVELCSSYWSFQFSIKFTYLFHVVLLFQLFSLNLFWVFEFNVSLLTSYIWIII